MFYLRQDYILLMSKQISFLLGELGSIPSGSIEIIIGIFGMFGRYFALAVDSDDSVENVKKRIQDKTGIPTDEQELLVFSAVTSQNTLSDDGTLSDYNIHNGCMLILSSTHATYSIIAEVAIRTFTGKMITLTVTQTSTIGGVKTEIEHRERIPSDQKRLVFGDRVLEDHNNLYVYGEIEHKSILDLKEIVMEIFIKTLSGEVVELNVLPSDTIRMVKREREKVEGFPPGKTPILAYDGRQLDDDATLAQHNIQNSSTLCEVASDGKFNLTYIISSVEYLIL